MGCGRRHGIQRQMPKAAKTTWKNARVQTDPTQKADNESLYFSNAETFTQLFGDHWGGAVEDKKKVKKNTSWNHIKTLHYLQ